MRLPRSLRKTIAAALAFTTLTVPLAGCSRTVTTGGLSGKGVLGDFLVGGLYGGFLGGFFGDDEAPGKDLPDGAFTVDLPRANDERRLVEAVGMDALRYYVHARLATKKLTRMNAKNAKIEEYVKQLRETAALWERATLFAETAQKLGAALAKKETKPGYKPLARIEKSPFGGDLFFSVAYAREGWGDERPPEAAEREDREKARREWVPANAAKWSESIVNTYDKLPAGQKIEGLAKQLGVDAKEASKQLNDAVSHLNRNYIGGVVNVSNQEAAQIYDVGMRTSAAADGACRVSLYVGGVVLAAPVLEAGAATPGVQNWVVANLYTGLVDTIFNATNDLCIVMTGESSPGLDKATKYTGALSALTGGVMLSTSLKDFAIRGPKAVEDTQKLLKAVNLNPKGFLDQYKLGGAGIQAAINTTLFAKDRLKELNEGKIFYYQLFTDSNGNTIFVPTNRTDPPKALAQASEADLSGLLLSPEMIAAIMEKIQKENADLTAEIAKEDARRWDEIGKAENRRRKEMEAELEKNRRKRGGMLSGTVSSISLGDDSKQSSSPQRTEDLPYAAPKLAGRYTIVNPEHPKDFAVRVIIKAQDDKTIRAIRVQKWSDKKGDVLFVARIDPKTGKSLPQQGLDVKFSYSEAAGAYTGYMAEQTITDQRQSGLLRMVQH